MTLRPGFGHAVQANGWRYWFGLMRWWVRWFARFRRPIALVRALTTVGLRGYYGELCQICGRRYVLWWCTDQALYDAVSGSSGAGLFCPNCFDGLADRQGIDLQWAPHRFAPVGSREPDQP